MRLFASLRKSFSDFWKAKGTFSQLSRISLHRALLTAGAILMATVGGYYLIRYQPTIGKLRKNADLKAYVDWRDSLALEDKTTRVSQFSTTLREVDSLVNSCNDTARLITEMTSAIVRTGSNTYGDMRGTESVPRIYR